MSEYNQTYKFTTDVSPASDQEFEVEFYQCLVDDHDLPEKIPYKVTKTFDELIDFLDQMDE
jgi:hypothetical protein